MARGVLLHDNAPVHKSQKPIAAISDCGFEELNHPPYRPDFASRDYFLL
jgi:hypothetical protein